METQQTEGQQSSPLKRQYGTSDSIQTLIKLQHAPTTRFHPYSSPESIGTTPSNPCIGVSSPGFSPYPPLSGEQIERLKEEAKNPGSQVGLISDICALLYGERPAHDVLVASLGAALDAKPDSRTFSALTAEDYLLLNPGESGSVFYNKEQLDDHISDAAIPVDFWPSLQTLRHTFSRRMEMGVKQIIGHFLAYAVKIAQNQFVDAKRLVVHSEIDLPAVYIPEIGRVKGPLQYLTCCAAGAIAMGKCLKHRNLTSVDKLMDEMDGADVKPSKPYFICVEAKRWQAFGIDISRAQLLAQIRALQNLR
jgi:hypothetical protein